MTAHQITGNFDAFRKLDFSNTTDNVIERLERRSINNIACSLCDAIADAVIEDPAAYMLENAEGVPCFTASFFQFRQPEPFCVVETGMVDVPAQTKAYRTDLGYRFNIFHDTIDSIRFTAMLKKLEGDDELTRPFKDMTLKEELAWLMTNGLSFVGLGWVGRLKLFYTALRYLFLKVRKAKGYPYQAMAERIDTLPIVPVDILREEKEVTVVFALREQLPELSENKTLLCLKVTLFDTDNDPVFK